MMMTISDHQIKRFTGNRRTACFVVNDLREVKLKMLNLAKRFNIFCLLDNQQYPDGDIECILALGEVKSLKSEDSNSLKKLETFCTSEKDWIFGHLSYDLKNEIENLRSENFDGVEFPDLYFFIPETVITVKSGFLNIESLTEDPNEVYKELSSVRLPDESKLPKQINFQSRFSKPEYIKTVQQLQQHIQRGDCYEITFCQEFFCDNSEIDPIHLYSNLTQISPNPFSAFYKNHDKYVLCASPERFLKKNKTKIISQPIKGTSKRVQVDKEQDEISKNKLLESAKERSENVMIVDLVRNDLSKICKENSVSVDELFGIYAFPQVHQMISTVSGELATNNIAEILRALFPMGSMTGAPKKRVMELIEIFERTKRGLFSGSIGYFDPEGNFDFNVVIRSLLYNHSKKYLSAHVGSAITFFSDAEQEYEECLLKLSAISSL